MAERSRVLAGIRLLAVYLFVAALLVAARPTPGALAAGSVVAFCGEALRVWASGHLVKSSRLITSGPYAYLQHPLYLGRLLIVTGLAIAAPCPLALNLFALTAAYAVFFLYYLPRKRRVEGSRLRRRHGLLFERYSLAVPFLVPSMRRYPDAAPARWSFGLAIRNREPAVLLGLLLAFGLLAWRCAAPCAPPNAILGQAPKPSPSPTRPTP